MTKRKIAVLTGARADYGRIKSVLDAIKKHPKLDLSLIVTGMHLVPEMGNSYKLIEQDGFDIDAKVPMYSHAGDTGGAMVKDYAKCTSGMADALDRIKPDIFLISVDRVETLAGAVAGAFMNLPLAHIQGGEVTGTIDENIRHAVTKFSHVHFPANKDAADRIISMGENPKYVFTVGCPYFDIIHNLDYTSKEELVKQFGLNPNKPLALFVQHPVTTEEKDSARQFFNTFEALKKFDLETILLYPNIDAGGKRIIEEIKKSNAKHYMVLPFRTYLSLLKISDFMIGNSSSAIREAPTFKLPAVNIGTRQQGRQRSSNVINVGYETAEIVKGIEKVLYDKEFRENLNTCENPYDPFADGKGGERIANILADLDLKMLPIQKRMTY
ncbi:MAG: UDP-N-acetylglucosamine 2-epimerase [archaeon]